MKNNTLLLIITFLFSLNLSAQRKVAFNGLLTDGSGTPIKSARIYVRTSKDYALTNKKGQFGLTNVFPNDTLKILIKKKLYQVLVDGKKSMKIRLADEKNIQSQEDAELIDLGFGYIRRREHTGVSNIISGEELRKSGYHNVIEALQGRVPGLSVTGQGAQGKAMDVNIRGNRSFTASSTPVYVIDNVVVSSFDGLNLNDVDYVEVMKDASIYGSSGANGAIIVHTKTFNNENKSD